MEPIFVVLPGHYESISTAGSNDPNLSRNIIRIVGCDNSGYWIDSDGKRYTESDLQHNWVALDTAPTNKKQKSSVDLLKGFRPTPNPTETYQYAAPSPGPDYTEQYPDEDFDVPPHELSTSLQRPVASIKREDSQRLSASHQAEQIQSVSKQSDKFSEIDFLLNKAHIDVLNQQSQENYGISKYKPAVIQLNLEFEIPYDLSKIQQIIELFNLKPIDVVNYLYQTVEYPEASIKQKLRNLLIPDVPLGAAPVVAQMGAPIVAPVETPVQPVFEPDKPVSKPVIQTLSEQKESVKKSKKVSFFDDLR